MIHKQDRTRKVRDKKDAFSVIPEDLFIFLMLIISIKDVYMLELVSAHFHKKINQLLNINDSFWKKKAELLYGQERLFECSNYRFLVNQQLELEPFMRKEINENKNNFISKALVSTTHKTDIKFFSVLDEIFSKNIPNDPNDIDSYKFSKKVLNKNAVTFSLKEINKLILADDSETLFTKTTRLNKLMAVCIFDGLSGKSILDSLNSLITLNDNQFLLSDLFFIGLLPYIIRARAIESFDLFMRAYLYISFAINANNLFKFTTSFDMTFKCEDNYFKNHLAKLIFKILPVDHPLLFEAISYYSENNSIEFIKNNLPKDNLPMMESLVKHFNDDDKFDFLFEEKSRDTDLREELLNEQQEILSRYALFFQDFSSNAGNLTLQKLDMFTALLAQQYDALRNNIHSLETLNNPLVQQTAKEDDEIYQSALMP